MTSAPAKRIAILGSTGSIGRQALEVIAASPDRFIVEVLTAQRNAATLVEQAFQFKPNAVVIADDSQYETVKKALSSEPIKVYGGENALASVVQMEDLDVVLTALVGYAGLKPTLKAIEAGKTIALANKETLVVAGALVTRLARQHRANLLPVDSEHSAIFQCLAGELQNLTASGGPFRGKKRPELAKVSKAEALKHPNWNMGAKITVDSATLMNKGLEVIEARWLFGVPAEKIEVLIHPQSIIHSMVQFEDGSIKAQLGLPDMRLPIQYALAYPARMKNDFPRFDFARYPALTFEKPDTETFRNLALAFEALERGGNMACVLNAANEVAVAEFLNDRLSFLGISEVVEQCLANSDYVKEPSLEDYVETDKMTRIRAKELIG
jgi:1-deoxy-D-xylulose-5-phosphate reductoisomerase